MWPADQEAAHAKGKSRNVSREKTILTSIICTNSDDHPISGILYGDRKSSAIGPKACTIAPWCAGGIEYVEWDFQFGGNDFPLLAVSQIADAPDPTVS